MRGERVLNFNKMWMVLGREFSVLLNELESLGTILKGIWRLEGEVAGLEEGEAASVGFGVSPGEGAGLTDRRQLPKC